MVLLICPVYWMEIFSYQRSEPAAFFRLKGKIRLRLMFRSGKVSDTVESRVLCETLKVLDSVRPMSGNVREYLTLEVLVLCAYRLGS